MKDLFTGPLRLTPSGGIVNADEWFLNYRNCTCPTGLFWTGQKCDGCPPNLHCDSLAHGTRHHVLGAFYPQIDGHLAPPESYPFSQLVPCATANGCNPGDGLVCSSGRDQEFRACSKCLPGWFALDAACFECSAATPYLVLVFLPVTMLLLAFYAWKRSTRYPAQGAGVAICIFGLQLLTVMERFYHQNSVSSTSQDLPDVLMVLEKNWRLKWKSRTFLMHVVLTYLFHARMC